MDKYEEAKKVAEKYVGLAYQADMGYELVTFLCLAVRNQELILIEGDANKEERKRKRKCYEGYKQVLLLAEATKQSIVINVAKKCCEEYE